MMDNKKLEKAVPMELNDVQLGSVLGGMEEGMGLENRNPDLDLLQILLYQDSKSTIISDLDSILDSKQTERISGDEYISKSSAK